MLTSIAKPLTLSILFWASGSHYVLAQDAVPQVQAEELAPTTSTRKVVRIVEPIPYWVEEDQLRVRDNPYAGDVIGMLKFGQKIQVRQTVDDWLLISAADKPERWVNRNFVSSTPVTWASYKVGSHATRGLGNTRFYNGVDDATKKRVKVKGVKDVKVYAANIKRLGSNKKLVISRHDSSAGAYFEKRLVQCEGEAATHVKILGEGYTVMMMEADPRKERIGAPMLDMDQVQNEDVSLIDSALASFTCETDKL